MFTNTTTATETSTRAQVISDQIEWLLTRLLPKNSELYFNKFVGPALQQQILHSIYFYGVDNRGLAQVQLRIAINWRVHQRRNAASVSFRKPSGWTTLISPELSKSVVHFERNLERNNLHQRAFLRLWKGSGFFEGINLPRRRRPRMHAEIVLHDTPLREIDEVGLRFVVAGEG